MHSVYLFIAPTFLLIVRDSQVVQHYYEDLELNKIIKPKYKVRFHLVGCVPSTKHIQFSRFGSGKQQGLTRVHITF